MHLYELYDIAKGSNIPIECAELPLNSSIAIPINEKISVIVIDPLRLKSNADEKVKLAHELGHCMTGSFYNRYSRADIIGKHEEKANRWSIKHLVPFDNLMFNLQSGIVEIWELAEVYNVTEAFIEKTLKYYRMMYPDKFIIEVY